MLRISILTLYPADSASARFCCHAVEAPGGIAKRRHGPIRVYRPQTSPNRPLGTLVYRPPSPLYRGRGRARFVGSTIAPTAEVTIGARILGLGIGPDKCVLVPVAVFLHPDESLGDEHGDGVAATRVRSLLR